MVAYLTLRDPALNPNPGDFRESSKTPFMENVIALARLLDRPICFLDTETTGFAKTPGVVEIAWVRVETNGEILSQEHILDPEMPIDPDASRIHGFWDKDVAGKPAFPSIEVELRRALDGAVFSGFNAAQYDARVLTGNLNRYRLPDLELEHKMDVRDLWKRLMRTTTGKLGEVAGHYGAALGPAHRAMGDVITTLNVLDAMVIRHGTQEMLMHASELMRNGSRQHYGQQTVFTGSKRQSYNQASSQAYRKPAPLTPVQPEQPKVTKKAMMEQAVLAEVRQAGWLGEQDMARLAQQIGVQETSLSFCVSDMYVAGMLSREVLTCQEQQALMEPHLPDAIRASEKGFLRPMKEYLDQMTGANISYIQLRIGLDIHREREAQQQRGGLDRPRG